MLLEKETGKYKLLTNYFPVMSALHANMNSLQFFVFRNTGDLPVWT